MQLTSIQRKHFHEGLLDAFPTKGALEQLVSFGLNKNLTEIAGSANLSTTVFELIRWAEAGNSVPELLSAAFALNPGNLKLKAVFQEINQVAGPGSSSSLAQPSVRVMKPEPQLLKLTIRPRYVSSRAKPLHITAREDALIKDILVVICQEYGLKLSTKISDGVEQKGVPEGAYLYRVKPRWQVWRNDMLNYPLGRDTTLQDNGIRDGDTLDFYP